MIVIADWKKLIYKYKYYILMATVTAFLLLFVSHDYFLYDRPVGRIMELQETYEGNHTWTQQLSVLIKSSNEKGKVITIESRYGYGEVATEKYRIGDEVFLSSAKAEGIGHPSIVGIKRDGYVAALGALTVFLLLAIYRRRGLLSLLSLIINITVFCTGIKAYQNGSDLLTICLILALLFSVITMLLINGCNKQSFAAIVSTLLTLLAAMGILYAAVRFGGEVDYANLDYIAGDFELEKMFFASNLIAGLGAIMDIAISITATVNELVLKKPDITYGQLLKSGRNVGYDIMGTMINVLLFTYCCGLIPQFLIKMKNEVSVFTIVSLHIPFEICRFLMGGISILLAIPVSLVIACAFYGNRRAV